MTDEDDLAALGAGLPKLDVDDTSAQMIAKKARASVGRPSRRRWILPITAAVFVAAFLVYAIAKVVEALG